VYESHLGCNERSIVEGHYSLLVERSQRRELNYRADLDGLRGVAIALVVLYHLSEFRFPGGFIGVDVFFVLSGYLITRMIHSQVGRGEFILREFVYRRIRRLFPALILVLFLTMLLGAFLLEAYERTRLGLYVISAVTFTTNFLALSDTSYFFPTADQPLIHLWSLAVEEQFYVLLPLLLITVRRLRWSLRAALWVTTCLSMIANLVATSAGSELAFFLSPARFWQLGAGALVAVHTPMGNSVRKATSHFWTLTGLAALATLLSATFLINERVEYPGVAALIPTISAVVLLRENGFNSIVARLLSARPLRYLGLLSYPLYLFHYPLLTLFQAGATSLERTMSGLLAIAGATILAALTYHFVEHPIRFGGTGLPRLDNRLRSRHRSRKSSTWASLLCAGLLLAGLLGLVEYKALSRLPAGSLIADLNSAATKPNSDSRCHAKHEWQTSRHFSKNGCTDTDPSRSRTILLWGDSHAGSLAPGLRSYLDGVATDLVQITAGACEPLWDSRFFPSPQCSDIVDFAMSAVERIEPDIVILHSRWDLVLGSIDELGLDRETVIVDFLTSLRASGGSEILVVGPVPTFTAGLPALLLQEVQRNPSYELPLRSIQWVDPSSLKADRDLRNLATSFPAGVRYLSLIDGICNADGCLIRVGDDPRTDLLVWDYGHLTRAASEFLVRELIADALFDG